jgi:hypothetical protein
MNIAPSEIDRYPAIKMKNEYKLNRMDFNAMFLHREMRGMDSFRFLNGEQREYTYYGEGE